MKKALLIITLICSLIAITSCSEVSQTTTTGQFEAGAIILPEAMSVDSSDGALQIPFETDGDVEAISWSSSDNSIATVDEDGLISVYKDGQVTITAISGTNIASTNVVATFEKYTNYIRIRTKTEFLAIFSNPLNFSDPDKFFCLATDLDFGGDHIDPIGGWDLSDDVIPMDPNTQFRATFDGRGYALKNFTISNPISTKVEGSYFGVSLFPFIYDGKVLNLNIIDAVFSGTGFTGSIAGKILFGTIENCFVKATIISTSKNLGIPSGGIAGIIGPDAIVKNVFLDVRIEGGYIYSGFNFGTGTNCNAVSDTLDDENRRGPIKNTAETTLKNNEEEDAALHDFLNSARIEHDQLGDMDNYSLTESAKANFWTISEGYMPYLIRVDGLTPSWALIQEVN